ncbi:MAG TPA: polyprenyl synthetase family protein [Fulvivirga sp.]|nr:polyprenyl synthetase family protein [Fulvivirga sp.]
MQKRVAKLQSLLENKIKAHQYGSTPKELYEPIRYIMNLGGKRLRPILSMLSYSLFKEDPESILDQALAIEVFHNFTLMHDDIMDEAPLRRGKATVHEKWNSNTAILSGDVMLVKAYQLLLSTRKKQLKKVVRVFSDCAAQVCEGQQMDMLFETKAKVTELEYLEMIKLKTAVLLGMSLEMGAILAEANKKNQLALRDFGINIGIGFQLKDDLLDVYGEKEKFGKQVGGDIMANKKTFLLIKALEGANREQKARLKTLIAQSGALAANKVSEVTAIYNEMGIRELTEAKMNEYFDKGFAALRNVETTLINKAALKGFAEALADRQH